MNISKTMFFSMTIAAIILTMQMTGYARAESTKIADIHKVEMTNNITGNFVRGAKLWANRCASCHNMRDPKDFTDNEWKATIMHMRVRAGLSGQDARDILKFLQNSN